MPSTATSASLRHPVDRFFLSTKGTPLRYSVVQPVFARLTQQAGLQPRSPRCRPRLHDIRHAMAVRALVDCYATGGDVHALVPLLATWLGHGDGGGDLLGVEGSHDVTDRVPGVDVVVVDALHHGGFCLEDLQPCRTGCVAGDASVAVGRLPRHDLPGPGAEQPAPPVAFGDFGPFVMPTPRLCRVDALWPGSGLLTVH